MVSLTLRASLTLVAHRDRVLSSLAIVPPTCLPSRLSQRPRLLYPSWHESCSGKCVQRSYPAPWYILRASLGEAYGQRVIPASRENGVRIPILEEAASMPTVSLPRSRRMKTDKKQPARIDGNECLERYLRDVRHYSVLSPSKLWKAARSGRSSFWSTSYIFPCCWPGGHVYVRAQCA